MNKKAADAARVLLAAYDRLDEQMANPTLISAEIAEIVKERDRIGELLEALGITSR
jgi:hypothetical protein